MYLLAILSEIKHDRNSNQLGGVLQLIKTLPLLSCMFINLIFFFMLRILGLSRGTWKLLV